jgi:hypothetical protein
VRGNGLLLLLGGIPPVVAEPVLAPFERVRGQVELPRVRLTEGGEVGYVAEDVGIGEGFGDLPVVGGVATQGRNRPRCGRRVGPGPKRCGGEHRLWADLEQYLAVELGEGVHALGELHRLAGVPTPVAAIELHAAAQRVAGAVVDQNPLGRREVELLRIRLELVEDRVQ